MLEIGLIKVNVKIYDAINLENNKNNTYIAQYLTKQRQSGYGISLVYRITFEIIFFKNHSENEAGP